MAPKTKSSGSFRPFKGLGDLVRRRRIKLSPETDKLDPPPKLSKLPSADESLSDDELFRQAMEEVRPLGWSDVPLRLPGPMEVPERARDESEALVRLQSLVTGHGELDPFATGDGVEGASSERGRFHLGKLKKGGYSVQAHLDLHGLGLEEAKARFEAFLRRSQHLGHSCVRIVHGKGKHSATEPAVLKTHLTRWLGSRKLSRTVVAFASARWKDGGSGAVYVLLYRKRRPPQS
jgi:DNA-nicking Smr family endonuclease